jgi:hypothetical protein
MQKREELPESIEMTYQRGPCEVKKYTTGRGYRLSCKQERHYQVC